MFDQVTRLKVAMREKLKIQDIKQFDKGDEVVIVIEDKVENSYMAEVGVGECWKFPPNYDIVGKMFTETSKAFIQNTIKVNTKEKSKSRQILCAQAPIGFIRKIDEAIWDGKFTDLEDLIQIIDDL